MKANDGSGNVIERDDWETPQGWFDLMNKQYNFSLDCCATKENTKCIFWEEDFLDRNLTNNKNTSWMNPPFSKALHMFDHFFKIIKKGVAIYRCDNFETKIWQEIIFPNADWVFIPKGRINYVHNGRNATGSRFPSAFIGVGVQPPKFNNNIGTLLRIKNESQEKTERSGDE